MIEIKYILQESDYLQLHLYFFKSEGQLKRLTRKAWIAFLIITAIICGLLIWKDEFYLAIVIVITACAISIFHKRQMKKVYEKQFKKTIKSYESRFNTEVYLKIDSQLHVKSIAGETNLNFNEVVSISETPNHFFIKLKVQAIIIPKQNMENLEELTRDLKKVAEKCGVEYVTDNDWKW